METLGQQDPQLNASACGSGLSSPFHWDPDQAVPGLAKQHQSSKCGGPIWYPPASSQSIKMVNGLSWVIRWKVQQMSKPAQPAFYYQDTSWWLLCPLTKYCIGDLVLPTYVVIARDLESKPSISLASDWLRGQVSGP